MKYDPFYSPFTKTARRTTTYLRIVANYRPQKEDPYHVRFTVSENRIYYSGNVAAPTTELATVKIHLNNVILDVNTSRLTINIKDYHLSTPMNRYKYMRIHQRLVHTS